VRKNRRIQIALALLIAFVVFTAARCDRHRPSARLRPRRRKSLPKGAYGAICASRVRLCGLALYPLHFPRPSTALAPALARSAKGTTLTRASMA
jgi:hypothetical protein